MSSFDVILNNSRNPPMCPHGPTVLFSRAIKDGKRDFYACAACRDRKLCKFFVWADELSKVMKTKNQIWEREKKAFLGTINPRKLYLVFNEINSLSPSQRVFCLSCSQFQSKRLKGEHKDHELLTNISDYQLSHPCEILPPLEDTKKEAQFLFSKSTVETIVNFFDKLNYKNVICMGSPKVHEYILDTCPQMNTLLLDIDSRFHNFYGPLQFCWYNMFNHHFFFSDARDVFRSFLEGSSETETVILIDPPFGGRVELISQTLKLINKEFQSQNAKGTSSDLPVFLMYPYFMEPQINNHLPGYTMLDYKVDYNNHPLFKDGPKGRKQGSPVRIFTNVNPSLIVLPEEEGYGFCETCKRWVSEENKHCKKCNECTSKDGRTYVHCNICKRCVKPTWIHCKECNRCAQIDHKCGELAFIKECFHCKRPGHKKRECPSVDHEALHKKRKLNIKTKSKSKKNKKLI